MIPTFIITNNIKVPYIDEFFDDFVYNSLTMINPKWLENNRMNRFNWKTPKKLYFYEEAGKDDLFVPRGFMPNMAEYLNDKNIKFKIDNKTNILTRINFKLFGNLKPFQEIAIKEMLPQNEGTLCAPTGSGKTVMGIYMIAERKQPAIIIVHTKELLYQWIDRIKQFLDIKEQHIGKIGDGHLDEYKNITVALIQTLRNYPEIVNQYSFLIVDECHRCPSKTFTDVVKEFSGKYITGLSATPYRRDGLTKVIEWYTGKIHHKIPPQELIKSGDITGIRSIIRRTDFVSSLEDPSAEYSKLLQELSQDEERNEMIIEDIVSAAASGETCLILSDRKAHCQRLYESIDSFTLSFKMQYILLTAILTGDTSSVKRKHIIKEINDGKIKILIATSQLIGEGFDCKNLSALFLTLPISYHGRVIQYLGRVLRPAKNKNKAIVYDYFDQNIRCLYNGFKNRQKEYKKLEG